MTDTELVIAGRTLYEQILAIPFGHDEMLAFGQAVFSKTPWGALTPAGKIAMFRLTAALTPPTKGLERVTPPEVLPDPVAEIVGASGDTMPSPASATASDNDGTASPPGASDSTASDSTTIGADE